MQQELSLTGRNKMQGINVILNDPVAKFKRYKQSIINFSNISYLTQYIQNITILTCN